MSSTPKSALACNASGVRVATSWSLEIRCGGCDLLPSVRWTIFPVEPACFFLMIVPTVSEALIIWVRRENKRRPGEFPGWDLC
jgi:hypothetical protein